MKVEFVIGSHLCSKRFFSGYSTVASMIYLLFCASFALKTYHYGQDVCYFHKTKRKAALKQLFMKTFEATCKNSAESNQKQQNPSPALQLLINFFLLSFVH